MSRHRQLQQEVVYDSTSSSSIGINLTLLMHTSTLLSAGIFSFDIKTYYFASEDALDALPSCFAGVLAPTTSILSVCCGGILAGGWCGCRADKDEVLSGLLCCVLVCGSSCCCLREAAAVLWSLLLHRRYFP